MNYKESKEILEEIKKAKKILLNCHRGPDPDSVGSALALYKVLIKMGKKVDIICPNQVRDDIGFLKNSEKVKVVDFKKFDFSKYDLFITQDSASWYLVSGDKKFPKPNISIIAIDHHKTNEIFGKINLVKDKISSNAEVLYLLLEDWGVKIDKDIASALLTGIIADTGVFRYPGTTARTLEIGAELMKKGADRDLIVSSIYFDLDFNILKFYSEVLKAMVFDKELGFVWSAIPYKTFLKYGKLMEARNMAAGAFAQSVKDSNFGIIMVEDGKNKLSISLRSKKGYDISPIATALGGGGHKSAAGAKVEGMEFNKAVEKVLRVSRKFAKNND